MRRLIALVMLCALLAGFGGTFAYARLVKPVMADPGPPNGLAVQEQNLDSSGSIRTHEQGTAYVNVTNAALPVTGNLKMVSQGAVTILSLASAARTAPGDSGQLAVGTVNTVMLGVNVTGFSNPAVHCALFGVDTLGADGVWYHLQIGAYPVIASCFSLTDNQRTVSIGPSLTINLTFTGTVKLWWRATDSTLSVDIPTTITFSASMTGR
jgi:hypothetical protein